MARCLVLVLNGLFLMPLLCYIMFVGTISVSAIPTSQTDDDNTHLKTVPYTPKKSLDNLQFTGGHWFSGPNLITFFIRTDDFESDSDNIKIPDTYLMLNGERILMSSNLNYSEGIGLMRTGKFGYSIKLLFITSNGD